MVLSVVCVHHVYLCNVPRVTVGEVSGPDLIVLHYVCVVGSVVVGTVSRDATGVRC